MQLSAPSHLILVAACFAYASAAPFGEREGLEVALVEAMSTERTLRSTARGESRPSNARATILYVVLGSTSLPLRKKYMKEKWATESHSIVFYDEASPFAECQTEVLLQNWPRLQEMKGKEPSVQHLGYRCAQQRFIYAVQYVLSMNTDFDWLVLVDDDSFVNTER